MKYTYYPEFKCILSFKKRTQTIHNHQIKLKREPLPSLKASSGLRRYRCRSYASCNDCQVKDWDFSLAASSRSATTHPQTTNTHFVMRYPNFDYKIGIISTFYIFIDFLSQNDSDKNFFEVTCKWTLDLNENWQIITLMNYETYVFPFHSTILEKSR